MGLGALLLTQTSYFTEQSIKQGLAIVKGKIQELTGSFITSEIKEDGAAFVHRIGQTHGDVIEVASPTLIQEEFSRADTKYAAWGWVNMGTTVTEIKVPATYRFHIKLSEVKEVRVQDGIMKVVIPRIIPTVPVAFDSQKIERKSSSGWLRFNEVTQLSELERNLTPALEARASGKLQLVKELARKDIQAFFERVLPQVSPETPKIEKVEVYFEGEDLRKSPPQVENPTT